MCSLTYVQAVRKRWQGCVAHGKFSMQMRWLIRAKYKSEKPGEYLCLLSEDPPKPLYLASPPSTPRPLLLPRDRHRNGPSSRSLVPLATPYRASRYAASSIESINSSSKYPTVSIMVIAPTGCSRGKREISESWFIQKDAILSYRGGFWP